MIEIGAPNTFMHSPIAIGGSKSISNRLWMIKKLFVPDLTFSNVSDSEDTRLLIHAFEKITENGSGIIDVNHAGSNLRFLTAFLAITEGEWTLTGSSRLKERPIQELVNALKLLGADISYIEKENFPPLKIIGKKLSGGKAEINAGISSQFISALLLIAPTFENGLNLQLNGQIVSRPYISMTLSLLKEIGVELSENDNCICVSPLKKKPFQQHRKIESDWSSASYFYSICALSENAQLVLKQFNQNSLQADSVLPDIFKELGVKTEFLNDSLVLSSIPTHTKKFKYDCSACPDIAQTLAVTCFGLGIDCKLSGLSTLKLKETDRLLALKTELEKFGAKVDVGLDSIQVLQEPGNLKQETRSMKHETIETYKDHRMAMSFAPLALTYRKICINDPSVVNKSYPHFWEDLKSLGFNVNLTP
jgi:3-phosphoshikimate 1-carboxyvinyltransferase